MEDNRTSFDTHVQETLSAFRRTRDAQDIEGVRTGVRDLTVWLDKLDAEFGRVAGAESAYSEMMCVE